MYVISRSVGGLSLNGKEYLIDDIDGREMVFDTPADCTNFLLNNGISEKELVCFDYEEVVNSPYIHP